MEILADGADSVASEWKGVFVAGKPRIVISELSKFSFSRILTSVKFHIEFLLCRQCLGNPGISKDHMIVLLAYRTNIWPIWKETLLKTIDLK